jgi:hypothetical protein
MRLQPDYLKLARMKSNQGAAHVQPAPQKARRANVAHADPRTASHLLHRNRKWFKFVLNRFFTCSGVSTAAAKVIPLAVCRAG